MGQKKTTFSKFEKDLEWFKVSDNGRKWLLQWVNDRKRDPAWATLSGGPRLLQLTNDPADDGKRDKKGKARLTSVGYEQSKGVFTDVGWVPEPEPEPGPPATFDEMWNSEWMQWYMEFSRKSLTTENQLFVFEALEYQNMSAEDQPEEYLKIVNTYIKQPSDQQVNISSGTRNQVMSADVVMMMTEGGHIFEELGFEPSEATMDPKVTKPEEVFNMAVKEIMDLMRRNYPTFLSWYAKQPKA